MSQWSDAFRILSPESAAEPGKWRTERNEPMRTIMDAIGDRETEEVVVMSSAQIGKSEAILNIMGYYIDLDPAPILMIMPTLDTAKAFSTDRIAPMLRDTKQLRGKIKDARSRDSGNKILYKKFPGGQLTLAGANSPASLASRPIRIVLADEVDKYPASAGTEGDPISLARKRTTTFWNKKIIQTSTPGIKGISRIESAYDNSDQRRFHVPCPDCGEAQVLKWAGVKWPQGRPWEAEYSCEHCGTLWNDDTRREAIAKGTWIADAPFKGIAGFHLNEIYSPWVLLGDMAENFLNSKGHPERFKTFVNSSLGESFEESAEKVDAHVLESRAEEWEEAPEGVLVITCGVDVQDDRLEIERVGWGVEEESWSLDHTILYGDPSSPELWEELDELLTTPTGRADGAELPVHATCIDSAGHHTNSVYKFCKSRFGRRVYAIVGRSGQGKPVWPKRASTNNKGRVNLFTVGVDAAKDAIYARARIEMVGPGYCHFPKGRDHLYFEQFTSEVVKTEYHKGFPHRVYVLPSGKRNEALDLRVYAYAALQALNVRWGKILAAQVQPVAQRPVVRPGGTKNEDVAVPSAFRLPGPEGAPPPRPPGRPMAVRRSNWMQR